LRGFEMGFLIIIRFDKKEEDMLEFDDYE